ncbi:MAG: hypothetical protein ABIL06_02525 [Pseudomonadota bacterium]
MLGLVGVQSERFRKVTLRSQDLKTLSIIDTEYRYDGDGQVLRLGLQAYAHYWLEVNAMTKPMQVREDQSHYREQRT